MKKELQEEVEDLLPKNARKLKDDDDGIDSEYRMRKVVCSRRGFVQPKLILY